MNEEWWERAVAPLRRPATVFLSFAGNDREAALRLREHLRAAGILALVDVESFRPGDNFPLAINDALSRSDYYLLLWSRHAVDRPWVSAEWSAALVLDLQKRGAFLFVARLDTTPLPPLLAPRRYLDATGSWDAFVGELISTWTRDNRLPEPVLPAPCSDGRLGSGGDDQEAGGKPLAEVYVHNRALAVSHVVVVPELVTGAGLWSRVRQALQLKEGVSKFMGEAALSFCYELTTGGQQIPDTEAISMRIPDGAVVDLAVHVEVHARQETVTTMLWRGDAFPDDAVPDRGTGADPGQTAVSGPGIDSRLIRTLLDDAFAHLRPG